MSFKMIKQSKQEGIKLLKKCDRRKFYSFFFIGYNFLDWRFYKVVSIINGKDLGIVLWNQRLLEIRENIKDCWKENKEKVIYFL